MNGQTEVVPHGGNGLAAPSDFNPQPSSFQMMGAMAVEASRAMAETRAAIQMAKMDRRDMISVERNIENMCKRTGLAEAAMYAYPKGGQTVTGPSIRLAEALAQVYGNLDYGIIELEQKKGESVMMAYCHDLETNVRQRRIFTVRHELGTKKGTKELTDQRDIYEMNANYGSRRLRACILGIIPGDLVEKAERLCEDTLKKGGGAPIRDRIVMMTKAFEEIGVTVAMLEKRLGHKLDAIIEMELVSLRKLYQSIKDGMATVQDIFGPTQADTTSSVMSKLSEGTQPAPSQASSPASSPASSQPQASPQAPASAPAQGAAQAAPKPGTKAHVIAQIVARAKEVGLEEFEMRAEVSQRFGGKNLEDLTVADLQGYLNGLGAVK